jgi:hypothetical protein
MYMTLGAALVDLGARLPRGYGDGVTLGSALGRIS